MHGNGKENVNYPKQVTEKFLEDYLLAIQGVQSNKKLSQEEKLKGLLAPLIDLYESITPNYMNRHKFTDEGTIYLEEELDLSSLDQAPDTWKILPSWKISKFHSLDTGDEVIAVNYKKFLPTSQPALKNQKDFETTSMRSLYKIWLPFLTPKRIASKDTLDQILVCYTIKRAQNGDENARNQLCYLYKNKVRSRDTFDRVMKLLYSRLPRAESKTDLEPDDGPILEETKGVPYQWTDYEFRRDFRQTADAYLHLIIGGISPKNMLDLLRTGEDLGILPLPREVGDIFLYYFGEYIPKFIDDYVTFLGNTRELIEDPINEQKTLNLAESISKVLKYLPVDQAINNNSLEKLEYLRLHPGDQLKNEVVLKFATHIYLLALTLPYRIAPFVETLLDPCAPISSELNFMKDTEKGKIAKILGFCYRPQKMGPEKNLTTWLFGGRNSPQYGKLYQSLADYYLKDVRGRFGKREVQRDEKDEENYAKIPPGEVFEERAKMEEQFTIHHDLEALANKAGITSSDMTFLLDSQRLNTLDELAETYHLTRDQARYKKETLLIKIQRAAKNK